MGPDGLLAIDGIMKVCINGSRCDAAAKMDQAASFYYNEMSEEISGALSGDLTPTTVGQTDDNSFGPAS